MNLHYDKFICLFDYGDAHQKKTYVILVSELNET